jgi:hypothetical protein
MEYQVCSRCGGKPKPLTQFHKDKARSNGVKSACKDCLRPIAKAWSKERRADLSWWKQEKQKQRERRKDPKKRQAERNSQLRYRQTTKGRAIRMWLGAKARALRSGIQFTISQEFVQEKLREATEKFANAGIPFDYSPENKGLTPSLDQVMAGKGYTPSNTCVVHLCWNTFKGDWFTEEEAMQFVSTLANAYK